MTKFKHILSAALATMSLAGSAAATSYSISWSGDFGHRLEGEFGFAKGLKGVINADDIDYLKISIYRGSSLLGSRQWSDGTSDGVFNLNFDTAAGMFITGGDGFGAGGQAWFLQAGDLGCSTAGFFSGGFGEGVCYIDHSAGKPVSTGVVGQDLARGVPASRLTASLLQMPAVPLPAGGLLAVTAFALLAGLRRRKAA
ncbi:hypothetical protein AB1M95_01955 [Sulfitobacter sp. LCG007]